MFSPADVSSAKEHVDVVLVLLAGSLGALLSACLYIIKTHRDNDAKTDLLVEQHDKDIARLKEKSEQCEKTTATVEKHTKDIARAYTALGKVVTAHQINHPGQNIEL